MTIKKDEMKFTSKDILELTGISEHNFRELSRTRGKRGPILNLRSVKTFSNGKNSKKFYGFTEVLFVAIYKVIQDHKLPQSIVQQMYESYLERYYDGSASSEVFEIKCEFFSIGIKVGQLKRTLENQLLKMDKS